MKRKGSISKIDSKGTTAGQKKQKQSQNQKKPEQQNQNLKELEKKQPQQLEEENDPNYEYNSQKLVDTYIMCENENEISEIPQSPSRSPVRTNTKPQSPVRPLAPMRPQSPIRERGFYSRSILLPELEAEAAKVKKSKVAIDDLLLGASNPIIEKKKAFIEALGQIDGGSQSHPLLEEILQLPIPQEISNLPRSAVLKARLNGQVKCIKADQSYMNLQHELEIYAGLPLIVDMIWSYYFQTRKSLVLKAVLEQHVMDSHTRIITRDMILESIQKLLTIAPDWCQVQIIESKEYFKMIKKVEIYALTKKMIQDKYNNLDKNDLMVL
jgi:hypothetical protein